MSGSELMFLIILIVIAWLIYLLPLFYRRFRLAILAVGARNSGGGSQAPPLFCLSSSGWSRSLRQKDKGFGEYHGAIHFRMLGSGCGPYSRHCWQKR